MKRLFKTTNKITVLKTTFFLVVFFGFLLKYDLAQAGYCVYKEAEIVSASKIHTVSASSEQNCYDVSRANTANSSSVTKARYFESESEANTYYQGLVAEAKKTAEEMEKRQKEQEQDSLAGKIGNAIVSGIQGALLFVFNMLLYCVFIVMGVLLFIATTIMDWVINPNNFELIVSDNKAILSGWVMVRDILNIAFILVLLYSAFCTIFQIDKYSYKKILLTLVIMALLVNFSYPISRVIIDASNVMFYSLINKLFPDINNGSGLMASASSAYRITAIISPEFSNSATFQYTVQLIMAIIFTFILAITLLIIGLMLLIRLVVLAILIIFSPIGFVGAIFPGFQKYSDTWWDEIFKQSFFAPIMIFMVYLSIAIMNATHDNLKSNFQKVVKANIDSGKYSDYSNLIVTGAIMAIPLVILWTGMIVGKKMGGAGADLANKWVKGMAMKGAAAAGKAGWHKIDRDILAKGIKTKKGRTIIPPAIFSPTAFKESWKLRKQEKDKKIFGVATGDWRDKLNSAFSLGKEKTNYKQAALQSNILAKQKEVSETSEESAYLAEELSRAVKAKDKEKVASILRIFYGNNDQNEMIKTLTPERKTLYGLVDENGKPLENFDVTPENKKKMIEIVMQRAGMGEEDIYKQMSDLGEIAFAKGNYADFGMVKYDIEKRRYVKNDEQFQYAVGKASNVKAQTKTDVWHWNSFLKEGADGSIGDLHEFGEIQLANMTMSEVGQMNRVRRDFSQKLVTREDQMSSFSDRLRSGDMELLKKLYIPKGKEGDAQAIAQAKERGEAQARVIDKFIDELKAKAYGKEEKKEEQKEEKKEPSPIIDPRTNKPYVE